MSDDSADHLQFLTIVISARSLFVVVRNLFLACTRKCCSLELNLSCLCLPFAFLELFDLMSYRT